MANSKKRGKATGKGNGNGKTTKKAKVASSAASVKRIEIEDVALGVPILMPRKSTCLPDTYWFINDVITF
jgi:hypothetical protein